MKPWISVIIPCYNAWNYLSEAIESVKEHLAWSIFEIIVSDDWSNDNWITDNVLDFYEGQKWVKVLKHTNNRWAQFVRNKWLENVNLSHVFMLDADDLLNNTDEILSNWNYAQNAMKILENDNIWFVHASTIMFWNYDWYTISPYKLNKNLVLNKHHVPTYMTYRIEDAIKDGIYNEDIKKWQDWSAWVGLLNTRFKNWKRNDIEFINIPYYLYRDHSSVNRLSWWKVDEKEMIITTIDVYPEIFQNKYPNLDKWEIAEVIFNWKPTKLTDLLFIASNNSVELARKIVIERGWFISWNSMNLDELLKISASQWIDIAIDIKNKYCLELSSNSELWNIP